MTKPIPRAELEDMLDMYRDYPGAVLCTESAVSIIEELIRARDENKEWCELAEAGVLYVDNDHPAVVDKWPCNVPFAIDYFWKDFHEARTALAAAIRAAKGVG